VKTHFYFVSPIRLSKKSQGKWPKRLLKIKNKKNDCEKMGKRPLPKMKNLLPGYAKRAPPPSQKRKAPAFLGGL
jgi:hypothetical protein